MKAKEGFVYKQMHGTGVVVPVGETSREFRGMVTLNETGSFLWERMQTEVTRAELVRALTEAYDTDAETAEKDVDAFVAKLQEAGLLAE